jgi:undecaprenyl-diphosphatase
MDIFQALILGIVQGLTEFLPVSSSGHLVLVPALLGWAAPTIAFDTVLHLGTLFAVLAYFREDWVRIVRAGLGSIARRKVATPDERLAWYVAIGCVPAALAGVLFNKFFESMFSRPVMVGYFLLVTAGLLLASEALGRQHRELSKLRLPDALIIGLAQAVAILPGVSRSGATISGGLFIGLSREASARFSFLLAAPIIFGAGLVQMPKAVKAASGSSEMAALIIGFSAAAIVGYFAVSFMLRYLKTRSLYPFAAYCALVGLLIAFVAGPTWG